MSKVEPDRHPRERVSLRYRSTGHFSGCTGGRSSVYTLVPPPRGRGQFESPLTPEFYNVQSIHGTFLSVRHSPILLMTLITNRHTHLKPHPHSPYYRTSFVSNVTEDYLTPEIGSFDTPSPPASHPPHSQTPPTVNHTNSLTSVPPTDLTLSYWFTGGLLRPFVRSTLVRPDRPGYSPTLKQSIRSRRLS